MIVLLNICMGLVCWTVGALCVTIANEIGEATAKKRAAEKDLKAKIENLEEHLAELLKSNLDKKEK